MPNTKDIMERVAVQLDYRYDELDNWRKCISADEEQAAWESQKAELDALSADVSEWLANDNSS